MRTLRRSVLVGLVALALTACGNIGGTEGDMTPDEAYEKLRDDFETAVEAVAPGVTGQVFSEPATRDAPCGGLAGTERTSVTSALTGALGRSDWDGDVEAAAARLRPLAEERGYMLRLRERGGRPTALVLASSNDGGDAFVLRFGLTPDGAITLSGGTPCLPADEG